MWFEIILSPLAIFIWIFILMYILFTSLKRLGPKPRRSIMSLEPYACGEGIDKFPPEKIQLNVQLYKYAIYFTIFDVAIFILLLSFNANIIYFMIYICIILSALIMLPRR